MRKYVALPLALSLFTFNLNAIVILHTQPDASYRISPQAIPQMADLPDEGHGTLIAPRWVVTAAHAVNMMQAMPEEHFVRLAGRKRAVSHIVVYPDYPPAQEAWRKLFAGVKTADPDTFVEQYLSQMAAMHDIALLELAEPVTDVAPMPMDRDYARAGMLSTVYGAGATGTDLTGAAEKASRRTELRRAKNRLTQAEGPWLRFAFNCSAHAPALSGAIAGGDSGGPVTVKVGGRTYLAGVTHGLDGTPTEVKHVVEQLQNGSFRMGVCDQRFAAARIGYYTDWIDRTMSSSD